MFNGDALSKEGSHCICMSVILNDVVLKMDENCYPQLLSTIIFCIM